MFFQLEPKSVLAINDKVAAPTGIPQYIRPTARPRFCGDTASEASVIKIGMAAPRPAPASERTASNELKLLTHTVHKVKTANTAVDQISTCLRPIRSATRPPTSAPGNKPRIPALKNTPNCELSRPKCSRIPAAAIPAAWISKPSMTAIKKQMATVTIACRLSDLSIGESLFQSVFIKG